MLTKHPRHAVLSAAISLALAGCASTPDESEIISAAQYSGTTLADLEQTELSIEAQAIENASAENALESYRKAVELFQDAEKRNQSLRRMADLALASADADENAEDPDLRPEVSDAELDQSVDRMLYENFMREAQETENREEQFALLNLAESVATELDDMDLEANYNTAIVLYQKLLESSDNPEQRADAYYQLAKAYDLAGQWDQSRDTLDKLVTEYPESSLYPEAQFRRGEMLFSDGDFEYAAQAYKEVKVAGQETDFYQQALYKLGWSQYKLGEYDLALVEFFTLVDALYGTPELDDEKSMEAKLILDTKRASSLAFAQLDGAKTIRSWFAERGHREYEADIYRSLGSVYLTQERFKDAADAYDMFVDVYPESPLAPEFSSLNIDAYTKGGFPTLVIPAKEKFVDRYGINSNFWAAYPDARDGYSELLKSHILDLAQYNHALAQKSKKPKSYRLAADWYKQYLDTPPASEREAEVNHFYAQTLYAAEDYAEAVAQFEQTAYGYDAGYEKASEAAYFALVAYQAHISTLPNKTEQDKTILSDWRDRKINSSLKFAANYPAHENVPSVLRNVSEDQLAQGDVGAAVKTAGMLVNRQPAPSEEFMVYGWTTIANGEFDQQRYKVAEFAYNSALQFPSVKGTVRTQLQEQLAASVYKQAEEQQQAGELALAAASFLRVGEVYPQASIRKNAEFDAATLYINLEDYEKAIPVLEDFRQRYPNDDLNETIPDKLAVAYEKTGNFPAAAQQLTLIAKKYASGSNADKELSRQALWQAAEMQDRANDASASIAMYKQYIQAHPTPYDFRAEAQFRITEFYDKTGNQENRRYWLEQLGKTYADAGNQANDRVAWLAAWSAFTLAEQDYVAFESVKLVQPIRTTIAKKTDAMRKALSNYESIAAIGVAEYATAANYKIGQMYRVLARDMMDSERPSGLSDLELDQYDLLLEEQALPYEDQAIDILIANTDLVTEGLYDQWVKESFAELAKLLPGRYAKFEQVEDYVDIIY